MPEGWEVRRGFKRKEHVYTYGSFMLMSGRNQTNIVKQLLINLREINIIINIQENTNLDDEKKISRCQHHEDTDPGII